ncbi:MAG: hypothetical protein ACREVO_11190 [Steroidobacteraceae bacterium]
MEIRQFDKMADRDQAEYVGSLVQGAEDLLTNEGRPDLQEKMHKLFSTIPTGDKMFLGMTEFERNLALARVADVERAAKDPSAHRLEVEDALLVTLKRNNIPLSQDFIRDFRAFNNGFRPKFPSQQ